MSAIYVVVVAVVVVIVAVVVVLAEAVPKGSSGEVAPTHTTQSAKARRKPVLL